MISAKSISLVASDFPTRLEESEPEIDLSLVILSCHKKKGGKPECSDKAVLRSTLSFRGDPPRRRRQRRRYIDAFFANSMFLYRRVHDNLEKLWTKVRRER